MHNDRCGNPAYVVAVLLGAAYQDEPPLPLEIPLDTDSVHGVTQTLHEVIAWGAQQRGAQTDGRARASGVA